jgi:hypothetical protein
MMYFVPYVELVWLLVETEAPRMISPNYQRGLQLPVLFLSIIYYNSVVP